MNAVFASGSGYKLPFSLFENLIPVFLLRCENVTKCGLKLWSKTSIFCRNPTTFADIILSSAKEVISTKERNNRGVFFQDGDRQTGSCTFKRVFKLKSGSK